MQYWLAGNSESNRDGDGIEPQRIVDLPESAHIGIVLRQVFGSRHFSANGPSTVDERTRQQFHDLGIEVDDNGDFLEIESRRKAISTANRIVGIAMVVCYLVLAIPVTSPMGNSGNPIAALGGLACIGIPFAMMSLVAGTFIGWIGHWICWNSSLPVNRIVVTMSIAFHVILLVWAVLLHLQFIR